MSMEQGVFGRTPIGILQAAYWQMQRESEC